MTKFSIDYNPYLEKCVFKKNGKILSNTSRIASKENKRFQTLLGESVNWKGLPEEIARACDDDEVEILFRGRKIDFDDLKYVLDFYRGNTRFVLKLEESKNDADIIRELDMIIDDIKKKNLPEFQKENEKGRDIFDAYEEAKNGIFEVSVIATMSSGKSTLINSLLHTELLPSENKACTATIARILDNDDMEAYEAECYASDDRTVVYPRSVVTAEDLRKYNADERVTYINIVGSVPAIPDDKIRLRLNDTPGPNNSRDERHGELTDSIIKRTNSVVLYVMNATQFGINDDKALLEGISSEMKREGKQSRDKFLFVVNKCDALDEGKGETIDGLMSDVKNYLETKFGILDPILIFTSARLALLIRKDQKGEKLSRMERKDLNQIEDFVETDELHFEKYATLTPTISAKLKDDVAKYHEDEETWDMEALIHTGVPALEEIIREYIDKYAYPMKIRNAIGEIQSIIGGLNMKAKFDKKLSESKEELERVREEILDARRKHSESQPIYEEYKEKITRLQLNAGEEKKTQKAVELELEKMTREYNGKEKVDKADADQMISEFQEKLEQYQREWKRRLSREIDENIFRKCAEMLDDYSSMVRSILNNISIENYDFKKDNSFHEIRISNIEDIKRRNEQDRYRDETRWKNNPEREGFFGFFKFWEPKRISYTVSVKDGVDVNVKQIVVDIMNVFTGSMKDNIHNIYRQSEVQIEEYKDKFKENIDSLNERIREILDELEEKTKKSEVLKADVEKNRELANWVEKTENRINTLLAF